MANTRVKRTARNKVAPVKYTKRMKYCNQPDILVSILPTQVPAVTGRKALSVAIIRQTHSSSARKTSSRDGSSRP
jgi:hypothetical protein